MSIQPFWQQTEDWHTAGEPFRIVKDLPSGSLGNDLTVPQQRSLIISTPSHPLDLLRQSLCHEPRGHADMYGCFILPPNDAGALFGVLFWHKDGFSTACGHGTIALGYWAISQCLVSPRPSGTADIVMDVPSGRVVARATFDASGNAIYMDFINVASCQIAHPTSISIKSGASTMSMEVVLSFAGAVYACVDVGNLDLQVVPSNHQAFVDIARKIKAHFAGFVYRDMYDVYGVCFYEHQQDSPDAIRQRNVVVFADGQIDRSPCGSGTCARLAVLVAEGKLGLGEKAFVHESIVGTTFKASVVEIAPGNPFPTCIPRVRGTARLVGRMDFFIDPTDPIYPGFVLR